MSLQLQTVWTKLNNNRRSKDNRSLTFKGFSFASKFNKTSFGIDTTDFPFVKLTDIFNSKNEGGGDVVHPINGLYVHKSQLGDSPVIIDAENKRILDMDGNTIIDLSDDEDLKGASKNLVIKMLKAAFNSNF